MVVKVVKGRNSRYNCCCRDYNKVEKDLFISIASLCFYYKKCCDKTDNYKQQGIEKEQICIKEIKILNKDIDACRRQEPRKKGVNKGEVFPSFKHKDAPVIKDEKSQGA